MSLTGTQDRRRHRATEVHVEPAPASVGVALGEARDALAHPAAQLSAGLHAIQYLAGLDPRQDRERQEQQSGTTNSPVDFYPGPPGQVRR